MRPLEEELRTALRRRDPPPGFTARVTARAEAEAGLGDAREGTRRRRPWNWFGRRLSLTFGAVAAAAVILVLAISFALWQQQRITRERKEGEAARAQLMAALRVTAQKLDHVRAKMREAAQNGVGARGQRRTQD